MLTTIRLALLSLFVLFATAPLASGAETLTAVRTDSAPTLDGRADDPAWSHAPALEILDQIVQEKIILKAVYKGDQVYFLVQFPDPVEDRLHKPWVWDKELEVYTLGPQREDTFTFKWSMEIQPVDLSNFSDDSYTADVWYWKANRTDPVGYSDDKSHVLADSPGKKATEVTSKSGRTRYLMRLGDQGDPAQKKRILLDYAGDVQDQYVTQQPGGSRADIEAKGNWQNGLWTVEFARRLDTGHPDDLQFDPAADKSYLFGVSVFGLYAEPIDRNQSSLYGQGRISEPLQLSFK